jgi:hypothetical protein
MEFNNFHSNGSKKYTVFVYSLLPNEEEERGHFFSLSSATQIAHITINWLDDYIQAFLKASNLILQVLI